jgi:hypothetical protein
MQGMLVFGDQLKPKFEKSLRLNLYSMQRVLSNSLLSWIFVKIAAPM